jgi:HD-GYP domain-containing protein (c-di-GMP phosphodiesterase class II)
VKVADAYDAMTSDRPYRSGKSHAEALAVLRSVCGSEMDPSVVEAFALLGDQRKQQAALVGAQSLRSLSQAVRAETGRSVPAAPAGREAAPEVTEQVAVPERETS